MTDWGKGTSNNDIGWGQGAINNLISWGISYYNSWSGDTDIIGSRIPSIVNTFKERVLADGGTFEASACLTDSLTELNNIQ